jgi:hypothetical protein
MAIFNGQEVWITGGLDRGKKGIVVSSSWGVCSVKLDSETKTYDKGSVSTTDPKTHNVPLPPSFIPSEFKIGDTVEVHGHPAGDHYNGIKGTVTRLPTSTSYRNGGDLRYEFEVTGKGSTAYSIGKGMYFEPQWLRKAAKAERIVGYQINHRDVQIGDTIRVELHTKKGRYSKSFVKEGKVSAISTKLKPVKDDYDTYSFRSSEDGWSDVLNYNEKDEQIFLVEAAKDPYIEIVENLGAGTVIVHEKETGEVLSYIKSLPFIRQSQWHVISSQTNRSSTFVDDLEIINALNDGAKIVHKVRKPKLVAVPF